VVTVLLFRRGVVGEIIALAARWRTAGHGEGTGQLSAKPAE
jgi:hypothetical protein